MKRTLLFLLLCTALLSLWWGPGSFSFPESWIFWQLRLPRTALALLNNGAFRYVGEWSAPGSAILEFEGVIDGITINGGDMIWWDEAGLITRFKVMVRPLKAVTLMHERMGALLAAAQGQPRRGV